MIDVFSQDTDKVIASSFGIIRLLTQAQPQCL